MVKHGCLLYYSNSFSHFDLLPRLPGRGATASSITSVMFAASLLLLSSILFSLTSIAYFERSITQN